MVETNELNLKVDKESIELERNFKGVYKWLIRLKSDLLNDADLKRLDELDKKVAALFEGAGDKND